MQDAVFSCDSHLHHLPHVKPARLPPFDSKESEWTGQVETSDYTVDIVKYCTRPGLFCPEHQQNRSRYIRDHRAVILRANVSKTMRLLICIKSPGNGFHPP